MDDDAINLENVEREIGHAIILALRREEKSRDHRIPINNRMTELAKQARRSTGLDFDHLHIFERIQPFLREAHKHACIFDSISKIVLGRVGEECDDNQYMWSLYHLNITSLPVQLYNARESFKNDEVKSVLGQHMANKIVRLFDTKFPDITAARDSFVHSHDRNFGKKKNGKHIKFSEETRVRR